MARQHVLKQVNDRTYGGVAFMSLSVAEVAKVALLARLRVDPGELETFTGQLNSIVDYVAQLQELDTTGVEPLAHGIEVRNVFRDDVRGPVTRPRESAGQCPQAKPGGLPGSRRSGMIAWTLAREMRDAASAAHGRAAHAEDADR